MGKVLRFSRRRKAGRGQRGLFDGEGLIPVPDFTLRPRGPSDARPDPGIPTDAVPSREADRASGETSDEARRRQRQRRRSAVVALVALFLGGSGAALFGARGYLDVRQKRSEMERVRAAVEVQEERVSALRRSVARLRDEPAAVERIARERLGYVRPGELSLVLPPPEGDGLEDTGGSAIVPRAKSTSTRGGAVR